LFIGVPVCLMVLASDSLNLWIEPILPGGWLGSAILLGAMLSSAGLVFFFAPVLLVRVWKTRPLPPGPLRSDLERMCRDMGLRYRDILVWRSGGVVANAAAMGLAAPVRYILLSDGMLENMDQRQVVSIFAHEAGHVVWRHIFYSAIFAVATIILSMPVGGLFAWLAGWPGQAADALSLPVLAAAWVAGFGWISRRFEWQCDAFSAWACSREPPPEDGAILPEGAMLFAAALGRVAQLGGIPYRKRNWRHGSIERRIDRVVELGITGGSRRSIDRTVRRIKVGLWAALAAAVAITAIQMALPG
jgi:STE24 endopeptidase